MFRLVSNKVVDKIMNLFSLNDVTTLLFQHWNSDTFIRKTVIKTDTKLVVNDRTNLKRQLSFKSFRNTTHFGAWNLPFPSSLKNHNHFNLTLFMLIGFMSFQLEFFISVSVKCKTKKKSSFSLKFRWKRISNRNFRLRKCLGSESSNRIRQCFKETRFDPFQHNCFTKTSLFDSALFADAAND